MKSSSVFVCQNCGYQSPKWQGQCPSCQNWNSLVETAVSTQISTRRLAGQISKTNFSKPLKLSEVESLQFAREKTGISELDRVLGGGIVPGSVVLLAGEPGMGKSTLLTQLAIELTKFQSSNSKFQNILYVCGEESPSQVKLRVERLNSKTLKLSNSNLYLLAETNVEVIVQSAAKSLKKAKLLIVDSIQTLWTGNLSGMAGSVGQIRESANILADYAKKNNVPVFLVGHVTKEGSIAGPKILEHLVDTVLYLEGDKNHQFRILRAVKNRFGPTDEVGVFLMEEEGMMEVANAASAFLQENKIVQTQAGNCTVVVMQGQRPILVEIQALCVNSSLPVPRRISRGIDTNRVQILCAVLQKKCGISLYNQDVFLSIAGGIKVTEPAIDFGICLAIASSYKNKKLPENLAAIGEVGLLGEVRKVAFFAKRVKQAKALGFDQVLGPDKYLQVSQAIRQFLK